jgi:hypothetical protein
MSVVTPPRKPANGAGPRRIQMTRAEKQAILDNFDLEGTRPSPRPSLPLPSR